MSTYTAITIGPIIATLCKARKTREIWAASYLFSNLMKRLVDNMPKKENIIIPYRLNHKNLNGIGLYPDHLVYKHGTEETKIDIENIKQLAIEQILSDIMEGEKTIVSVFNKKGKQEKTYLKKDLKEFLSNYIQIYHFELTICEKELGERNFLNEIDDIFNTIELEQKFIQENPNFTIADFFRLIPNMPMYKRVDTLGFKKRCKSLVEITTAQFENTTFSNGQTYAGLVKKYIEENDESADEVFLDKIKEYTGDRFKNYHKYIAVVQCDGDKMGAFNKNYIRESKLDGAKAIQNVSNTLFEWGESAALAVQKFGGLSIYAGGDDLLFFAPIVNSGQQTIINLLEDISIDFTEKFNALLTHNNLKNIPAPTLSFGLSISFYRYPLNEATSSALNVLGEMKREKGRNGVNIKMLKHSGSDFTFHLSFSKNAVKESFDKIMSIQDLNEQMMSSTAYHLQENRNLIQTIFASEKNKNIRPFFENNMEGFPKANLETHFLLEVEKLVIHSFKTENNDKQTNNPMLPVFDLLRVVKFLKGIDQTH